MKLSEVMGIPISYEMVTFTNPVRKPLATAHIMRDPQRDSDPPLYCGRRPSNEPLWHFGRMTASYIEHFYSPTRYLCRQCYGRWLKETGGYTRKEQAS